jgi:hypothetical protein
MFRTIDEMEALLSKCLRMKGDTVLDVLDPKAFHGDLINALVRNAVFNSNPTLRTRLRKIIRSTANKMGIYSYDLGPAYSAISTGQLKPQRFAVLRIGGHCLDLVRLIMRAAKSENTAGFVLEQAWTGQSLWEFSALVMAAAMRESWTGPLFLRSTLPNANTFNFADEHSPAERIHIALEADYHNLAFRICKNGLNSQKALGTLEELVRYSNKVDGGKQTCISFSLTDESGSPSYDEARAFSKNIHESLKDVGKYPELLSLPLSCREWGDQRLKTICDDTNLLGLSISGCTPEQMADDVTVNMIPATVKELRVRLELAKMIVNHWEYPATHRVPLIKWLKEFHENENPGQNLDDDKLLELHEFKALGHLEFDIWNLEEMPEFRNDFESMIRNIFRACRIGGNRDKLIEIYADKSA